MKPGRSRGFTLIELLAALAIFTLISSSLYGALGISVRAFDSAARRADAEQRMRVVRGFVQRTLEQGFPLALVRRGGWRLLFEGDTRSLHYVTDLPGFIGFGGLYETILRSRRESGRKVLLLERRPLIVDRNRGELSGTLERQILLQDLQALRLRYYGIAPGEKQPRWHEEWADSRRLPLLVEAQITTGDGDAWAPLVAQLRPDSPRFQMAQAAVASGVSSLVPRPAAAPPYDSRSRSTPSAAPGTLQ